MHIAEMTTACSYWQRDPQWLQTIVHPQFPGSVSKHGLQTWPAWYAERLLCCIMCWWNVFQCLTFLCEQLLTSVVHRPTGACSDIYRITTKCYATRQLSDSAAECEYTSKDAFITWGKLLHVLRQTFWTVLQRMTLYHILQRHGRQRVLFALSPHKAAASS